MIELPRLEAPELAAAAVVFRRRTPLALDTAAGTLTLEPVLDASEPPAAAPFRLDLRLGEGRAALTVAAGLAQALLGPALPGVELAGLDPEMRALAVELAVAPLATAAEAALGRPVRVEPAPAPAPLPYRLDFRVALAGGAPWPLRLDLDLRGLEAVTRAFERAPVAPAGLDDLVVPLVAEAGRTRLPLADLDRAAPGDLVLLEEGPTATGRLDLVFGGVLAFACRLGGTTLSYTGEARTRVPDGANAAAVETLDEVPVELVFELGRVTVPLGELRTLAPGHVFDLGRDLRHPVDVLLAGRKVGEGELVQVGERVGVRLRSLVPPR